MKIRHGFVSNSSSSSFIGTICEIVDKEKFDKWYSSNKDKMDTGGDQYDIKSGKEILEAKGKSKWYAIVSGDFYDYISERTTLSMAKENPNTLFFITSGTGPDGDSSFSEYDEDGEWVDYNYDVDLSDFNEIDQEIFNATENKQGLKVIEREYYAGRDG